VREIQRGQEDFQDGHRSGRPVLGYINTKIISILEKALFESTCSIAQVLNVDHAIVLYRLYEKLGLISYGLQWVLHLLTVELRPKCKERT
jgi:hypothetical protein